MIVVDTSAWVAYLRPNPTPVSDLLDGLIERRERLVTCDAIRMELLAGARDANDEARLLTLLDACTDRPLTRNHYEFAARIYRQCRGSGVTVRSQIDCLVAAVALELGVPVLHEDRDFRHIATVFDDLVVYTEPAVDEQPLIVEPAPARERNYEVGVRVQLSDQSQAQEVLGNAGLVVRDPQAGAHPTMAVLVAVAPGTEGEDVRLRDAVHAALEAADVYYEDDHVSISMQGGTANHAWGVVLVDGALAIVNGGPLKIMTGPGVDHDRHLRHVAELLQVEPSRLTVARPPGMPPNT